MTAAYRVEVPARAKSLLMGGFTPDEVCSILAVEFGLDEFQIEDLPTLVKHIDRAWAKHRDNPNIY